MGICGNMKIYAYMCMYIYIGKFGVFRSLTLGVTIRLAENPCENEVETGLISEFTVMTMLATAARKQLWPPFCYLLVRSLREKTLAII